MNDTDKPALGNSNNILFCKSKKNIIKLKQNAVNIPNTKNIPIEDNGFKCKPWEAINRVKEGKHDKDSIILNCLNTYCDFIAAIGETYNGGDIVQVKKIADFLTFDYDLQSCFSKSSNKDICCNFIHWATGVIINRSQII